MTDRDDYLDNGGSWLRLVLADWARERAEVTLTLRSGVQLTGQVKRRTDSDPCPEVVELTAAVEVSTPTGRRRKEVKHDVRLTEIAAVSAVAR